MSTTKRREVDRASDRWFLGERRRILVRELRAHAAPREAAFGAWLLRVARRVSDAARATAASGGTRSPRVLEHLAHGVAVRLIHGPCVADASLLDAVEAAMLAAEFGVAHTLLMEAGLADPRKYAATDIAQINALLRRAG